MLGVDGLRRAGLFCPHGLVARPLGGQQGGSRVAFVWRHPVAGARGLRGILGLFWPLWRPRAEYRDPRQRARAA